MSKLSPVDVNGRRALAREMRRFAAGRTSPKAFMLWGHALAHASPDEAVKFIAYLACRHVHEIRKAPKLTPSLRRRWAKFVLFLLVDREPYKAKEKNLVSLGLMVGLPVAGFAVGNVIGAGVGLLAGYTVLSAKHMVRMPHADYFPFQSKEAFERAKRVSSPFDLPA